MWSDKGEVGEIRSCEGSKGSAQRMAEHLEMGRVGFLGHQVIELIFGFLGHQVRNLGHFFQLWISRPWRTNSSPHFFILDF